jgi:hypothetical protein
LGQATFVARFGEEERTYENFFQYMESRFIEINIFLPNLIIPSLPA